MPKISWLCGCLLLLSATRATGAVPPAPDPAGAIVDRCIAASGGAALRAIRSETRRGTILRGQSGQVPVETRALAPGRWLYHQVFAFGDQVNYGCDGTDAWIQDTHGVTDLPAGERTDLVLLLDPQAPLRLRALFPRLEVIGDEAVGDRAAVTLRGTAADGATTELAFDRESGLLLRAGKLRFEDYRQADGVQRPRRVRLGRTDDSLHMEMKLEFTETRHDEPAAETTFARPTRHLPLADAPLYEDRAQVTVSPAAMNACVGVYQHPEQAGVTYTVTVWDGHLMLQRTGWPGPREILPTSETDYFLRFPDTSIHFARDASGRVTLMDIGKGTTRAARIQ